MATQIGSFTSGEARTRVLAAYDRAMAFWPEPRDEQDVETAFGVTRVYGYGAEGDGIPVVLLHGQSAGPTEWAPHVAALADGRRRVFAVDRVGEPGYSTQTAPVRTPDDMAAWLEEVLAGLGLERVHLVGHSYGGWVALNHAVRAPGRIASVAVYDPPRALASLKAGFVFGAIASFVGPEGFRYRWFTELIGPTGVPAEEAEAQTRFSLEAMRGFRIRLLPPQPMSDEELTGITVPALVLLGGESRVHDARRAEERARHLMPGAHVEVVPGAGHGIPVKVFNERVPEFVREAEDKQGAGA
ncbi:alpha/beta fold hydrolase [Streptomyces griseocarneus]|uniref:alpha/beta fold hydrolase n=1 Tax=Streptomyces griseocarneus TaxID=51201 RepID=UPI00167E9088|nr:alpha/beta fold hydrolase [Streptomyces griseocarneus]MBZ6472551.1 alpha/beta fold hydrolase [Streptomyces griseocarneus]GHG45875.1 carboxylesterase [Streptomyces griseocarneus]